MYFLDNWHKFVFVAIMIVAYSIGWSLYSGNAEVSKAEIAAQQLDEGGSLHLKERHVLENNAYPVGWALIGLVTFLIFIGDLRKMFRSISTACLLILCFTSIGCYRPFEPVKLEVVGSNEEAFLLPLLGDAKKQTSSNNEEYLTSNLVFTKQVKIPQQWVPKGYEYMGANGVWQDAAVLIKVDKAPVTREWTADTASGTSNKNEAIWVMTSDGVEWSTGWTITARISSREDAVKFLHNYPNGSLIKVLDTEVRSKLQSTFGLEVTDLPMSKLRLGATPHILNTTKQVTEFFKSRGITITNMGITGGFVYKDPTIMAMLVKVFNAEQQKEISKAELAAQTDINKKQVSIKETEASGLLEIAKGNAEKIKIDALAKLESSKAEAEGNALLAKSLTPELVRLKLFEKWDGTLPKFSGTATPLIDITSETK